jgi:hypothetical protein
MPSSKSRSHSQRQVLLVSIVPIVLSISLFPCPVPASDVLHAFLVRSVSQLLIPQFIVHRDQPRPSTASFVTNIFIQSGQLPVDLSLALPQTRRRGHCQYEFSILGRRDSDRIRASTQYHVSLVLVPLRLKYLHGLLRTCQSASVSDIPQYSPVFPSIP